MTHRDEQRALLLDVLTLRLYALIAAPLYRTPAPPPFRPFMAVRRG